ncbi:MAG: hypothetical protein ABL901_03895 [Hyphomicrobiaceae bacterium]
MSSVVDRGKARASHHSAQAYAWVSQKPLWAVALGAAAVMGLADLAANPAILTTVLGDTDDAARLIEVRELIAGQAWFDMRLWRFGGTEPLISHWSRIIDLPLAALVVLFSTVLGQDMAEVVTRMVWPTLLSGVIAYAVARYCETVLDRKTALLALLLVVPCTGHFQFTPGRIDHHNAMIIGAVAGTFALLASLSRPRIGWLAGVLLGFGCAVGFEGLGLTLAALGIVTLSALFVTEDLAGVARAAAAYAVTLLAAYLVFGPGRPDGLIVCDALSVNLIGLAGCAAAGVVLAHRARENGRSKLAAFGILASAGAVGVALYGYAQSACLAGPYGQVEPRLGPVWLDYVSEVRSLWAVARSSPSDGLSFAGYPLIALGYGVLVLRGRLMPHAGTYVAVFAVTVLFGLWQVRLLPYASYLSVPLIAVGLFRRAAETVAMPVKRRPPVAGGWNIAGGVAAAVAGLATVGFVLMAGQPGVAATPAVATSEAASRDFVSCTSGKSIKGLAGLPKGLAVNDIDLGSYLVAWTKLSVLSAPYHRMGRSILAAHDLLHASAAEAPLRMKAIGARYVVLCGALGDTVAVRAPGDALRAELLAGRVPDGLEAVAVDGGPVKVWQLKD